MSRVFKCKYYMVSKRVDNVEWKKQSMQRRKTKKIRRQLMLYQLLYSKVLNHQEVRKEKKKKLQHRLICIRIPVTVLLICQLIQLLHVNISLMQQKMINMDGDGNVQIHSNVFICIDYLKALLFFPKKKDKNKKKKPWQEAKMINLLLKKKLKKSEPLYQLKVLPQLQKKVSLLGKQGEQNKSKQILKIK